MIEKDEECKRKILEARVERKVDLLSQDPGDPRKGNPNSQVIKSCHCGLLMLAHPLVYEEKETAGTNDSPTLRCLIQAAQKEPKEAKGAQGSKGTSARCMLSSHKKRPYPGKQ